MLPARSIQLASIIGGPAIRIANPLHVLDLVVEQAFRSHTDGFCINLRNARLQGNWHWL